jgi:hypothetical protein
VGAAMLGRGCHPSRPVQSTLWIWIGFERRGLLRTTVQGTAFVPQ